MKKVARLIITKKCHLSCDGCANTYKSIMKHAIKIDALYDLPNDLDEIMITGGEPMLYPNETLKIVQILRGKYPSAGLFLYTTLFSKDLIWMLNYFDGMNFTVHWPTGIKEVEDLSRFQSLILDHIEHGSESYRTRSFRLYIDNRVNEVLYILPNLWDRIRISKWMTEEELLPVCLEAFSSGEQLYILNQKFFNKLKV